MAVVLERGRPIALGELAGAVDRRCEVTSGDGESPGLSPRAALHHRHLPILVDADLVARTDRGVAPGDHRLLAAPGVDAATLRRTGADWEALGAIYGQPRRTVAVSVLADAAPPVPVPTLAQTVAAERVGDVDPGARLVDDLAARFHHVDLPVLADAGVLTYDAGARRVTGVDDPDLPVPIPGF